MSSPRLIDERFDVFGSFDLAKSVHGIRKATLRPRACRANSIPENIDLYQGNPAEK